MSYCAFFFRRKSTCRYGSVTFPRHRLFLDKKFMLLWSFPRHGLFLDTNSMDCWGVLNNNSQRLLVTTLRVLDHWQVLDNGRRLLVTTLRVLDHWVFGYCSVPYLNQISKIPRGFGYNPKGCLLYTSPSPRDGLLSRMPSSA